MAGRILFDGVWKRFHRGPAHDSLRDLIPSLARRMTGRGPAKEDLGDGDFWAVRDVSFDVRPGQALGIIGGNGAGKSTTLKLLTKILRPTRGTALVEGRVGSLIEVSAGFHPDLSGRENVFLQGAIMGMPQALIRERFDEIVDFSGISAFIDTPVKRYSSGMNARLGFSIAVHLEPDVLIIDEVLSVGDASFQQQAFDRIKRMVQSDIPVVIVSHQLDRIVELCGDCILLRSGEVAFRGPPSEAIDAYLRPDNAATASEALLGDLAVTITTAELSAPTVDPGDRVMLRLAGGRVGPDRPNLHVSWQVRDAIRNKVLVYGGLTAINARPDAPGPWAREISLQANLPAGLFRIDTCIWDESTDLLPQVGPSVFLQVSQVDGGSGDYSLRPRIESGADQPILAPMAPPTT